MHERVTVLYDLAAKAEERLRQTLLAFSEFPDGVGAGAISALHADLEAINSLIDASRSTDPMMHARIERITAGFATNQ